MARCSYEVVYPVTNGIEYGCKRFLCLLPAKRIPAGIQFFCEGPVSR